MVPILLQHGPDDVLQFINGSDAFLSYRLVLGWIALGKV